MRRFSFLVFLFIFLKTASGQFPGSGNCLEFDGANDYIQLNSSFGNFNFPMTFSCWVKPNGNQVFKRFLITHDQTGAYRGIMFQQNTLGLNLQCGVGQSRSIGGRFGFLGSYFLTVGEWVFVTVVATDSVTAQFYVNGIPVSTIFGNGSATRSLATNSSNGRIASNTAGNNIKYLDGRMDELSFFDRALSASEVREIMGRGITAPVTGLFAEYDFNFNAGNAIGGIGSNCPNGTLTNGPTWQTSGAPIGDTSTFTYSSTANVTSHSMTLSNGNVAEVNNISPAAKGVQIYEVTQAPNTVAGLPAGFNAPNYVGVFIASDDPSQNYTYDFVVKNFGGTQQVYSRKANDSPQWGLRNGVVQGADYAIIGDQDRQEYIFDNQIIPSCFISEDYSSSTGWVSDNAGSEITISNGKVNFNNATDGSNKRVYKKLDSTLSDTCWRLRFDYFDIAGGVNNVVGHLILGLTEGSDCPLNTCGSTNIMGNHPNSNETGILVSTGSPRNNGPTHINVRSKLNTNIIQSPNITIQHGQQYYIEVARNNSISGTLGVFSDSLFQQHIPGSPVNFAIQNGIQNLDYIQHSTFPQGHPDRKLTAEVDNVCIEKTCVKCPAFSVSLGSDTSLCDLSNFSIGVANPDPNYIYTWNTNQVGASIVVNQAGTYWVVADSAGCGDSDTIVVGGGKGVSVELGPDTVICDSDSFRVAVQNPNSRFSYNWSTNQTGSSIIVKKSGSYWVEADSAGCTAFDTIVVTLHPDSSNVSLPRDTSLCREMGGLVSLNGNLMARWPDGSVGSSYQVFSTGELKMLIYSPCDTFSHSIFIRLEDCNCKVFIPNVFTPNFDGINDSFDLKAACTVESYRLRIYNRWGGRVFESFSINKSWDGTTNGQNAAEGAYFYVLEYGNSEKSFTEKNFLTLIR